MQIKVQEKHPSQSNFHPTSNPPPHLNHNAIPSSTQQSSQHSPVYTCPNGKQKCRPCQKFGLDLQKLQVEQLLQHRSYRRLYNIVANDQTQPNQIFRPNLIKQLYFLLQITPFIEPTLRDNFLSQIQELYNSNDHKKIKLAKNLDGIINNVLDKKSPTQKTINSIRNNIINTEKSYKKLPRPKTGVQWDKNLIPFLRPYTAKIHNNSNKQEINRNGNFFKVDKQRYMYRPDSSKYGGAASTMANTNTETLTEEKNNIYQLDGQYEENKISINDENNICDIEEEWERSEDFKKKYRTLHPQEEPTYEKLMNLISKVKVSLTTNSTHNNPQGLSINQRLSDDQDGFNLINSAPYTKSPFLNSSLKASSFVKKRNIQSAVLTRNQNNAHALAEQELKQHKEGREDNQKDGDSQEDNFGKENNDGEEDGDNSSQNSGKNVSPGEKKGVYTNDRRTKQGRKLQNKNNPNHIYTMLNGVKILRPYTAKQANIINRLNQYSSLQQNKKVIQGCQDEEIAQKYREYARRKTMMKREIVRKSESKRYMESFRDVVKVIPSRSNSLAAAQKKNNYMRDSDKSNVHLGKSDPNNIQSQKQIYREQKSFKSFFDFSSAINQAPKPVPLYNSREYFMNVKNKQILQSSRGIQKLDIQPELQKQNQLNKLTHQKRLLSEQKFNPLHKTNLDTYNQQVLQQIEKIKLRFNGKISASTDALFKALYVDAPLPLKELQNYNSTTIDKNKFEIPDKKYLMVQKQEKKKKRKLRKTGKSKSKSKSRR